MGKAKELAELGDKLTVTGSAVTVSGFNYDNIVDSAPGALDTCLLYTSPSPRDLSTSRMPSSA